MKCIAPIIKLDSKGNPILQLRLCCKVSNALADELVQSGKFHFISRKVWRIFGRQLGIQTTEPIQMKMPWEVNQ